MNKPLSIKLACLLALAGILLGGACYRQDILTVEIHVPQMRETECSRIIIRALREVDGIQSVRPDTENRVLTVTYNARKLALKNIEHTLAEQGFTANDEEARSDARMRLPPECR